MRTLKGSSFRLNLHARQLTTTIEIYVPWRLRKIPQLPVWLWGVMTIGIGFAEIQRIAVGFQPLDPVTKKADSALKPAYVPGDLNFDPLGLKLSSPTRSNVANSHSSNIVANSTAARPATVANSNTSNTVAKCC